MLQPGGEFAEGCSQFADRGLTGAAADREAARKEAILLLKGSNVRGSMENPPTNPSAVAAAGGQG